MNFFAKIFPDEILFLALQGALICFVCIAFYKEPLSQWLKPKIQKILKKVQPESHNAIRAQASASATVHRSEASMGRFYATFVFINGLFVAVCLSVEAAVGTRVFWVILDTVLIAYVCLFNNWFRNKLLHWSNNLMIEK